MFKKDKKKVEKVVWLVFMIDVLVVNIIEFLVIFVDDVFEFVLEEFIV